MRIRMFGIWNVTVQFSAHSQSNAIRKYSHSHLNAYNKCIRIGMANASRSVHQMPVFCKHDFVSPYHCLT